jgi:hypothetical protein
MVILKKNGRVFPLTVFTIYDYYRIYILNLIFILYIINYMLNTTLIIYSCLVFLIVRPKTVSFQTLFYTIWYAIYNLLTLLLFNCVVLYQTSVTRSERSRIPLGAVLWLLSLIFSRIYVFSIRFKSFNCGDWFITSKYWSSEYLLTKFDICFGILIC